MCWRREASRFKIGVISWREIDGRTSHRDPILCLLSYPIEVENTEIVKTIPGWNGEAEDTQRRVRCMMLYYSNDFRTTDRTVAMWCLKFGKILLDWPGDDFCKKFLNPNNYQEIRSYGKWQHFSQHHPCPCGRNDVEVETITVDSFLSCSVFK